MAKKVLLLPPIVLLMALLSSCVYKNLSRCPEPRLRFVYDADGSDNVLPKYIEDAHLCIYDESEAVCYTKQLTRQDFAKGIQLPVLTFVQYRVIAWANVTKQSQIANPDTFAKADIAARSDDKGFYRDTDSLYRTELSLDPRHISQGKYTVPLSSAHIGLDAIIKGYDAFHPGASEPQMGILSGSTYYAFVEHPTGIPLPDTDKAFIPILKHSQRDSTYRACFDPFRFTNAWASVPRLIDSRSGREIAEISITDYLKGHNISFGKLREANLPLLISFMTPLKITIEPFVWGSINIKPGQYER